MTELMLIVVGAALVNNFVLVQFLGVCPAMSAARRVEGAVGMGLATGLALTIASGASYAVDRLVLQRFDLQHLKLVSFVVVVALAVQATDLSIRRFSPLLHRVLGIYIPLVAGNCAVLGVALLNSAASRSLVAALFYCAGASLGFALALALLAGIRERLEHADVPAPFRGTSIVFVTAGILSLAFLGFAGFARL
jgi:Na+-translocating ferredoxin:NAD+ oxidoreductase subunit A